MLLYFPHIPKTGGTTLKSAFFDVLGRENVIGVWNPDRGGDVNPEGFVGLPRERLQQAGAVVGHLPLRKFVQNPEAKKLMDEDRVAMVTSIRHPLDRLISAYNYSALRPDLPRHQTVVGITPEQYMLDSRPNRQFEFLSCALFPDVEALARAMTLLPLQQSIEGFTRFLMTHTGREPKPMQIKNRSSDLSNGKKLLRREDFSAEVVQQVQALNAKDMALYTAARDAWECATSH